MHLKLLCHDLYLIERTEVEGVIYLISWWIDFTARVLGIYMCSEFFKVRLREFFDKLFLPHFVCEATWTAREIVAIFISWTTVSLQGKGSWSILKTLKCRALPRLLVGRFFSGLRVLEKAAHSFLRRHIGCDIFLPTTRKGCTSPDCQRRDDGDEDQECHEVENSNMIDDATLVTYVNRSAVGVMRYVMCIGIVYGCDTSSASIFEKK